MAGFSAEWLTLRERADHAARSVALTRALVEALPRDTALRILDLAAGTGSNCRYLMEAGSERTRPTYKGFGPALGPDATDCAARCFASLGYRVRPAASDWALPPEAGELQQQLIDLWAQAAAEIAPAQTATIDLWRRRRLAHVAANRSRLMVGHQDLAAWKSKDVRI